MSNLNADHEEGAYSGNHEPGSNWPESRNAEGLEDVDNASRPDSPVAGPFGAGADRSGVDSNGELAARGDVRIGQPEIPGLAYAEQSLSYHSGPLPHPEVLAAYDQARPGTADWIVSTAERAAATEAHATRVTADSEAFALRVFAVSSVGLPALVFVGGCAMAAFGMEDGWVVAALGATTPLMESVGKMIRSVRSSKGGSEES